jgi:sortase A
VTAATVAADAPPRIGQRRPRGPVARVALVLGELLITFGVIVFLFIFYELVVTGWKTSATQHRLAGQLSQQWKQPAPQAPTTPPKQPDGKPAIATDPPLTLTEGQGFAIIRIPRFGAGYHWVVVEGVGESDLQEGPGHYPGTAQPGQLGNMVISGHRTTYGQPFNRLGELKPGDLITLQTRYRTWTYKVTDTKIVEPTATYVILPVPGRFGATPAKRLLTLTTCNPEYSAAQRMVVFSELVGST